MASSILSETGQSSAVATYSLTSTLATMHHRPLALPVVGDWTCSFASLHVLRVLCWPFDPTVFCRAVCRRNQKVEQPLWAGLMAVNQAALAQNPDHGLDQFEGVDGVLFPSGCCNRTL